MCRVDSASERDPSTRMLERRRRLMPAGAFFELSKQGKTRLISY
jgi:hypothetical protein